MSEERRVKIYNCMDGYLIHDTDQGQIHYYINVERIDSVKTVREVLEEL